MNDRQDVTADAIDKAERGRGFNAALVTRIGCVIIVIAAALHSATRKVGGGDTWVAMANGRYTVGPWAQEQPDRRWQMRWLDRLGIHITQQDYMGPATRPYEGQSQVGYLIENIKANRGLPEEEQQDLPERFGWINQNWLTHVLFYKMNMAWGENSIVIYKFLQAVATALLSYWAARKLGAHAVLAAGAVAFGMLLSRSYIDLRPNQSSIFYAAAMLVVLVYWRSGCVKAMWWLIPIMILWSNVHGGFIYGMMVFTVVGAGHLVQNYLGKAAYVFVLLGLVVAMWLLVAGAGGLRDEADGLEQQVGQLEAAGRSDDAARVAVQLGSFRRWQWGGIGGAVALGAIAVLALVRLGGITRDSFVRVGGRGIGWLIGGAVAVFLIPGIFSPFGWDNVAHPLIIAMGNKGHVWRQVVEWRPIWDLLGGFGNAKPYTYFLWLFALVVLGWWVLFLLKPREDAVQGRKRRPSETEQLPWPKIDLAMIGVMAITLIMSIKSRRFIFLGGVMLAPFLAAMGQEIVNMVGVMRARKSQNKEVALPQLPAWLGKPAAAGGLVGALGLGAIFAVGMWDVYYREPFDGQELSVFRRMVGIQAQPVEAIKFFDDNEIEGVVLNEWVNGGFITFHQRADEETGRGRCRVFMDGRSQAAYELEHFQRWNALKNYITVLVRASSVEIAKARRQVRAIAEEMGISRNDAALYQKLAAGATRDGKLYGRIAPLAAKEPALHAAFLQLDIRRQGREWGLRGDESDFYEELVRRAGTDLSRYAGLIQLARGDVKLYDALLKHEGINVVLLDLMDQGRRGPVVLALLLGSGKWQPVYIDHKFVILIRRDDPANRHLIDDLTANTKYSDENMGKISLGYALCYAADRDLTRHGYLPERVGREQLDQGLALLLAAEFNHRVPRVNNVTVMAASMLGKEKELAEYFLSEQQRFKGQLEAGDTSRAARFDALRSLSIMSGMLSDLAQRTGQTELAAKYREASGRYQEQMRAEGMTRQSRGSVWRKWLWASDM